MAERLTTDEERAVREEAARGEWSEMVAALLAELDAVRDDLATARADVTRYDVAQMRGWDAIREAVSTMLGVPYHEAKYEMNAAEKLRELAAEHVRLRADLATLREAADATCTYAERIRRDRGHRPEAHFDALSLSAHALRAALEATRPREGT